MTPFQASQEASNRPMFLVTDLPGEPIEIESVRFARAVLKGQECILADGRQVPSARLHRYKQAASADANGLLRQRLAGFSDGSEEPTPFQRSFQR